MPFRLEPVSQDDLPTLSDMDMDAFAATNAFYHLVYPKGKTESARAENLKGREAALRDPNVVGKKVVDTDNSKMIAYAMWRIWREDEPREEWDVPIETNPEPSTEANRPDKNEAAWAEFIASTQVLNKKYVAGKKRIHLGFLATDPDYHRRGAGKMLLDWGSKWADEEGLQITLTATPVGKHLYQREGFEFVEGATSVIDMGKWGGKGDHISHLMIRPPQPKAGGS